MNHDKQPLHILIDIDWFTTTLILAKPACLIRKSHQIKSWFSMMAHVHDAQPGHLLLSGLKSHSSHNLVHSHKLFLNLHILGSRCPFKAQEEHALTHFRLGKRRVKRPTKRQKKKEDRKKPPMKPANQMDEYIVTTTTKAPLKAAHAASWPNCITVPNIDPRNILEADPVTILEIIWLVRRNTGMLMMLNIGPRINQMHAFVTIYWEVEA